MKSKSFLFATAVLSTIAIIRVIVTYSTTAQAFDEPCHVSAAIEWLDKHTYTLDPVHPPLSRIAIGLPLYLLGERYPHIPESEPENQRAIITTLSEMLFSTVMATLSATWLS